VHHRVRSDRLEAVIGLPANLFYSTAIPACLLTFRGTKPADRKGSVLFVDGSARFAKAKNQNVMSTADMDAIADAYRTGADPDRDGGPRTAPDPSTCSSSTNRDEPPAGRHTGTQVPSRRFSGPQRPLRGPLLADQVQNPLGGARTSPTPGFGRIVVIPLAADAGTRPSGAWSRDALHLAAELDRRAARAQASEATPRAAA